MAHTLHSKIQELIENYKLYLDHLAALEKEAADYGRYVSALKHQVAKIETQTTIKYLESLLK